MSDLNNTIAMWRVHVAQLESDVRIMKRFLASNKDISGKRVDPETRQGERALNGLRSTIRAKEKHLRKARKIKSQFKAVQRNKKANIRRI